MATFRIMKLFDVVDVDRSRLGKLRFIPRTYLEQYETLIWFGYMKSNWITRFISMWIDESKPISATFCYLILAWKLFIQSKRNDITTILQAAEAWLGLDCKQLTSDQVDSSDNLNEVMTAKMFDLNSLVWLRLWCSRDMLNGGLHEINRISRI